MASMMDFVLRGISILCCASWLFACGGGSAAAADGGGGGGAADDGGGGGGGGLAPSVLNSLVEASCVWQVRCGLMPNTTICTQTTTAEMSTGENATFFEAIAHGRIKYDSGKAATCASYVSSVSCRFSAMVAPSSCSSYFQGTVAPGYSCFLHEECTSGFCYKPSCADDATCCEGTCTTDLISSGGAGPPCMDSGDCNRFSYCDTTQMQPACRARLAEGEPCNSFDSCQNLLMCSESTGPGTCVPDVYAADGQICRAANNYLPCDNLNSYCDEQTSRCTPRHKVGSSCTPIDSYCVPYASCVDGTCVMKSGLGGLCLDSSDCLAGACKDGICAAPPPEPSCYGP